MVLTGESADIYAWNADDRAPVQAASAVVYNPSLASIVQAIEDAEGAALQSAIANSFPVGLTLTAAAAGAIEISNHFRRYTDGHAYVAVTGAMVASELAASTYCAIGYDAADRVGGAVAYQLFENGLDARASPDHPQVRIGTFVVQLGVSASLGGAILYTTLRSDRRLRRRVFGRSIHQNNRAISAKTKKTSPTAW